MLGIIIVLITFLALLGYVKFPFLNFKNLDLLVLNGHHISLFEVLIIALLIWGITLLPRFFKEVTAVLLVLWLMALLGIISIVGLKGLILIALIVGFLIYLFSGKKRSHK